jgi:predicted metalloprotease
LSICYGIGGLEEIESQREKGDANLVKTAYIVTLQTDEFLSIMEKELKRTRRLKQTWEHTVKINTDGAYDCNSGMGGLGFVIQTGRLSRQVWVN